MPRWPAKPEHKKTGRKPDLEKQPKERKKVFDLQPFEDQLNAREELEVQLRIDNARKMAGIERKIERVNFHSGQKYDYLVREIDHLKRSNAEMLEEQRQIRNSLPTRAALSLWLSDLLKSFGLKKNECRDENKA